jgi:hypothetical protein
MWVTLFALITAASVCLGMVSFAVQTHKEQAILASMDRSAHVSVEHPAPNGDADHPG